MIVNVALGKGKKFEWCLSIFDTGCVSTENYLGRAFGDSPPTELWWWIYDFPSTCANSRQCRVEYLSPDNEKNHIEDQSSSVWRTNEFVLRIAHFLDFSRLLGGMYRASIWKGNFFTYCRKKVLNLSWTFWYWMVSSLARREDIAQECVMNYSWTLFEGLEVKVFRVGGIYIAKVLKVWSIRKGLAKGRREVVRKSGESTVKWVHNVTLGFSEMNPRIMDILCVFVIKCASGWRQKNCVEMWKMDEYDKAAGIIFSKA